MAIKRGSKVQQSLNAASMTDMIFLLLMFMMIATTMINPNALRLLLPRSSNQLTERPYTTVSIDRNLNYYVELEPVSFSQLESALQAKLSDIDDPTVSLHSDENVPIGEVVKVMNIAKDNQYRLILATRSQ
jgi:biopolymer transport protein ExbD